MKEQDGTKKTPKKFALTGGRVICPSSGLSKEADLLIDGELIVGVDKPGSFKNNSEITCIDISGQLAVPGLHDIHVHFREPGFEWKETILTGSRAAVAGGFTTVCCMPNTNPINDSAEVTEFVVAEAKKAGLCNVYPIGAISVKSKGESMSPMLELKEAGCVAFSDDGRPVHNALIMRRALEYGKMFDAVLSVHEEELQLTSGFSMNESALSLKLGLVGMPGAAEDIMIARDIELARLTGGRVHFCHVSTARAVTLIRRAKEDGIPVTAEVMPHHFLLTEDAIGDYDTTYKMSMPLRKREDMEALLIGLKEGVIDCIASDHAPHEADSKNTDFSSASFGILGLQTTLPLSLSKVADGTLSMQRAIEALTVSPAKCFGLRTPTLKSGELADITIIDPKKEIKLTTKMIQSKSKNTPFIGQILKGVATKTFFKGKQVFSIEELEEV